jgi:(1->4)-alpha-D-glucan 1-alpha-D-glucosylmutase
MIKVVREAKLHTSWIAPEPAYEAAATEFVAAVLDPARSAEFLEDLASFQRRVAPIGLLNGLAQTTLKLASPGVPDIYQGCELWNFSLVDPDNRRPVDYAARRQLLRRLGRAGNVVPARDLLDAMPSGLPKLYVIRQVLALRARLSRLFERGDYVPLPSRGDLAGHVCAFARKDDGACVVVVVPRLIAALCAREGQPPLGDRWGGTEIELPAGLSSRGASFVDVLTGERHEPQSRLSLRRVLATFPVAVLAQGEATTHGGHLP